MSANDGKTDLRHGRFGKERAEHARTIQFSLLLISLLLIATVEARRDRAESAARQLRQITRLLEVWERDLFWLWDEVALRLSEEGMGYYPPLEPPPVPVGVSRGWSLRRSIGIPTGGGATNLDIVVNVGPWMRSATAQPIFQARIHQTRDWMMWPINERSDPPKDLEAFRAAWNALEHLSLYAPVEFSRGDVWFAESESDPADLRMYKFADPIVGAPHRTCFLGWAEGRPAPQAGAYPGHVWFSGTCPLSPSAKSKVWLMMRPTVFRVNGQERLVARHRRKFPPSNSERPPADSADFDISDWKGGSFERSFPDLSEVMSSIPALSYDQAAMLVEMERRRAGDALDLWGIRFPARSAFIWSSCALLCVQLYLLLHLGGKPWGDLSDAAWIGVYPDLLSRMVNQVASGALPPVAFLFAAAQQPVLALLLPASVALAVLTVQRLRAIERGLRDPAGTSPVGLAPDPSSSGPTDSRTIEKP
jgi:hypothetical protein